jgi:hypothetical protein
LNTDKEKRFFSAPKLPHPTLEHTQPPVQCEGGVSFPGVKLPGQDYFFNIPTYAPVIYTLKSTNLQ